MFKKLFLASALIPAIAAAQTAPTRPPGDNSNAIATTAYVAGFIAGTFSNFVNDDGPAIQAALNAASAAGGGFVGLNPAKPYWAQTQITIPSGVTLGCTQPPQKQLGNITGQNYVSIGCSLYLAPNNPIIVNGGAIRNAHILQDNIHFAGQPTTAHQLAAITQNYTTTGTGIKLNAPDSIVEDVAIAGFNLDIEDNSLNRGSLRHVLLEGTNCLKYDAVGDYSKGLDIECWPFYSTNRSFSSYTMAISGIADNGSGSWRVTLTSSPSEALVTGDTVFIGGTGAIVIPQGALGQHTITVINSTTFDLTGSQDAPVITGTTTTGSPFVTGLSTLNDLWQGETFTGTCFTGTRTVTTIQQNSTLTADANATSTGSCTLTFASQAFSAAGSPQATFSGRTDWTGVGIEFGGGGSASGGLFDNIFVWGHQVALQFDPNCITITIDTASIDFSPSAYDRNRIGILFQSGTKFNRVFGNSFTSGGTAVVNQNAAVAFSQANIVKLGRVNGWTWGSIENDNGALIVSGTVDVDNSNAAGQFDGDVFNVTGQFLWLADGSAFTNSRFYNSTFGQNTQAGTNGFTTDTSYVGTQTFVYPPGRVIFGNAGSGGVAGTITLMGSTSSSANISASASGQMQLANNTAGQVMVFNDAGNGVMFSLQSGVFWPKVLTIGTLPTCVAGITGARATVSNGSAPTYLGAVGTTGAVTVGVFCNGSSWLYD